MRVWAAETGPTSFRACLHSVSIQARVSDGGGRPPADGDGGVTDVIHAELLGLARRLWQGFTKANTLLPNVR